MKTTPCLFLLLVLSVVASAAEQSTDRPTNTLSLLKQERDQAENAYYKAAESLPETPQGEKQGQELWQSFDKKQGELFAAAVDLAKSEPKSDEALAALEWVLTIPRSYYLPAGIPAMELVTANHAANPKAGKVAAWVGYYIPHEGAESRPAALALVEAIAEKNPDRTARAQAVMARAWEARKRFEQTKGDAEAAQAERAFEAVVKDYADCPRLMREGRSLGEEAQQELFALRHLRIGKVAPEIAGEDLDGVKFKLSDYRGKVTALVFWASWCGPCMRMVPHERKLVERMKDKPFVLIGVNGDDDRKKAKQVATKEAMVWRSFWNGAGGPDGPISRGWNVRGWPTVYVLDGKGVIRSRATMDEELDRVVDQLVKELAVDK